MSVEAILSVALTVFYVIVGLLIIIKAYKANKTSVIYFGIVLLLNAVSYVGMLITIGWVQDVSRGLSMIFALIFTKLTFYQDRKGPFVYFLIFAIVVAIVQFPLSILSGMLEEINIYAFIGNTLFGSTLIVAAGWFSLASFEAHKQIKSLDIEPFQKKRYILFGTSGALLAFGGFMMVFWTPSKLISTLSLVVQGTVALVSVIFVIINYLVWMSPEFFKRYLNRGYKKVDADEPELSEEEIMRISKKGE